MNTACDARFSFALYSFASIAVFEAAGIAEITIGIENNSLSLTTPFSIK